MHIYSENGRLGEACTMEYSGERENYFERILLKNCMWGNPNETRLVGYGLLYEKLY